MISPVKKYSNFHGILEYLSAQKDIKSTSKCDRGEGGRLQELSQDSEVLGSSPHSNDCLMMQKFTRAVSGTLDTLFLGKYFFF